MGSLELRRLGCTKEQRRIWDAGAAGKKANQPCEISGGVAIGCFPRQEIRNVIKLRADLEMLI